MGNQVLYKQVKYTLENIFEIVENTGKGIRVAKRNYSYKLRIQFSSSYSASECKGLK